MKGLSFGNVPDVDNDDDLHFMWSPKVCPPDFQKFYDLWVGG